MAYLRPICKYAAVNGGVVLVASITSHLHGLILRVCDDASIRFGPAAAAICATAALYALVLSAAAINLHGRHRRREPSGASVLRPISWKSIWAHPVGSAFERYIHSFYLAAPVAASSRDLGSLALSGPLGSAVGICGWWLSLTVRLLAFEVVFDGLFYAAHRAVHVWPLLYRTVHKLHHRHTHDVRLLSSLQMSAADVVATHTLPVLGALAIVPFGGGLELSIAKTYLLFQEVYGHAGVEHKGRSFGPAPWIARALGIDLRAEDHQQHHIQGEVNFSKRFSLFDKLFGTWRAQHDAAPRAQSKHDAAPRAQSKHDAAPRAQSKHAGAHAAAHVGRSGCKTEEHSADCSLATPVTAAG